MTGLGKVIDHGTVTCPKCGLEYAKTVQNVGVKDQDKFKCDCGEVLASWKSIWVPSFRPLGGMRR